MTKPNPLHNPSHINWHFSGLTPGWNGATKENLNWEYQLTVNSVKALEPD